MERKPKWGKPKLIVLVRGKPEERVLTNCKLTVGGTGAGNSNAACNLVSNCKKCSAQGIVS